MGKDLPEKGKIAEVTLFTFEGNFPQAMHFRVFGFSCLFLLFSALALAQREDPNAREPKPLASDTVKINVMIGQISKLREADPSKAIKLCLETIALSKQLGFHKGIGRATGSLGWIYYHRGDFVRALEYSIESLKISEKIGDRLEVANSLNNMAGIEFEEKQRDMAIIHFRSALTIARQIGDIKTIGRTLNNIAYIYLLAWNNLDSAQGYASRALALSEITGDDYNGSYSNNTLGMLYAKKGKSGIALKHYFRSLALSDGVSNSLKVETWNQIAEVYVNENKIAEAIPVLLKNIETSKKYSYRESLALSYQLMSKAYQQQGKSSSALDYLQHYMSLHDSIYNEQNSMNLATRQSQFDLDMKQAQIELLTKDTQLGKKEISRQRIQLYATVGGLVAIMLIAGLLFYVNRKVHQSNSLLERQKEELANKNQEVELKSTELEIQADQLARLNATKDKLFSIIGHDFRSPLNSLKGILTLVENRDLSQEEFSSVVATLKSNLDAVSTNLENLLQWSLAQLRGIQTNPVNINMLALVEEHIVLYNELAKAKNIKLENNISENHFAFADENHIRLVLRNLINNAIKFTRSGGVVKISIQDETQFIKILVSDNGVGIESTQLRSILRKEKIPSKDGTNHEKGVGIGLLLCQEFVENNGGHLSVDSEPGKGSVFSFTLKAA